MKTACPLVFFFLLLSAGTCFAQAPGCPNVDAGPDQNLDCVTNCTQLTASIFQSGETSDYTVSSIPYAPPFPFTGGNQIFINLDDVWSNVVNLPFNFCFYGNMYNRVIVGANGLLSFDVTPAGNFCAWSYSATIPTPGPPPGGIYNNSINGAYHDIDPAVPSAPIPVFPFFGNPGNINFAVLGAAPCRTFVVNYSTVPQYQCNSLLTTQQIVLYETTNAIEVYIKDKPTCNGWNSGNAVIGLQNSDGTKGITPPGRNTGPWSTHNEAWRFMPSGNPNWALHWYDALGNPLGNTPTINVCPTGTSTYTVEGVYQACDGSVVVVQDEVTLNISNGFTSSLTHTDETCAGCNGTVDVTVSGGTPAFTYNIGNGPQATGNFTGLCPGNYTVTVGDAASCTGTLNVTIEPAPTITASASSTNETCAGLNDGTITLAGADGTDPYTYDIGFGPTNNTGLFTGLPPNTYSYIVTDATGCTFTGSLTVNTAQVCCLMTNTVVSTHPGCNAACDGTITLTENLGIPPVQFSIDNGTSFQQTGNFTGLCAGTYNILVQDGGNCQFTDVVALTDPAAVVVSGTGVSATCGCDGSIINVSATSDAGGPYQFSLDNGPFQAGNSFMNVCPGTRTVTAQDADGCTGSTTVVVGNSGTLSINDIVAVNPSCNTDCDASITIDATGAVNYSIDNGATFQATGSFSSLCAGVYNVIINDGGICQITDVVTLTDPAVLTLTAVATDVLCNGDCNGILNNTANGGTSPYQYSIDNGTTFQSSPQFMDLCAGAYITLVSDDNGCTATTGATVSAPSILVVSLIAADATCPGVCNGSVEVTTSGGVFPYTFSLPGMNPVNTPQINGLCAGSFQLTVTDDNNCAATSDFSIDEPVGITVNAGADDSVRIGEGIQLAPTFSDQSMVNSVIWSGEDGLNCTACVNPVASPLVTTTYTMNVADVNGCTYSDDVEIIVYSNPLVNIPNAFTPNGDGLNDLFSVTAWEVDIFKLLIYNRWGEKLFETDNIANGWDGTYKGKKMLPGVYVYVVDVVYLTGEKDLFKGSLTLLK